MDFIVIQPVMKLLYMYSYDYMMEKNIEGCTLNKGRERRKEKEKTKTSLCGL